MCYERILIAHPIFHEAWASRSTRAPRAGGECHICTSLCSEYFPTIEGNCTGGRPYESKVIKNNSSAEMELTPFKYSRELENEPHCV